MGGSFKAQTREIDEATRRLAEEEELFLMQQEELVKASEERQQLLNDEDRLMFLERKQAVTRKQI